MGDTRVCGLVFVVKPKNVCRFTFSSYLICLVLGPKTPVFWILSMLISLFIYSIHFLFSLTMQLKFYIYTYTHFGFYISFESFFYFCSILRFLILCFLLMYFGFHIFI